MSGIILLDGMISLFAAIGVAAVIWIVVGIWIKPKSYEGICAYTVFTADKLNAKLCEAIHSMLWWQDSLPDDRKIVLCGDFDDAQIDRFMRISCRRSDFAVVAPEELCAYLREHMAKSDTEETDGSGTDKAGGKC